MVSNNELGLRYDIGLLEPSELNLVLSSWKRSHRESCPNVRTDDYYRLQGAVIEEILSRFPLLLAARTPDGVVLGWICCEASDDSFVVHFANTKSAYRKQGICKALLAAAVDALSDAGEGLIYTHKTRRSHIFDALGFTYVPVGRFLRETGGAA